MGLFGPHVGEASPSCGIYFGNFSEVNGNLPAARHARIILAKAIHKSRARAINLESVMKENKFDRFFFFSGQSIK